MAAGYRLGAGRVNLIGEHTDYNDGFVLPMAIDRRVTVAAAPRMDDQIVAFSEEFNEQRKLPVRGETTAPSRAWDAYVTGLCRTVEANGIRVPAMSLLISGQGVPTGAGLSSSAALLMALARALSSAMSIGWEPLKMARFAQRAENDFVGVRGARMTGAGFGGCAIALVRSKAVDQFIRQVQPQYEARTYQRATFFAVKGDDGARLEVS